MKIKNKCDITLWCHVGMCHIGMCHVGMCHVGMCHVGMCHVGMLLQKVTHFCQLPDLRMSHAMHAMSLHKPK